MTNLPRYLFASIEYLRNIDWEEMTPLFARRCVNGRVNRHRIIRTRVRSRRLRRRTLLCVLLTMGASTAVVAAADLKSIRSSHVDNTSRVVLDMSEDVRFSTGSAGDPFRFFIDLEGVELGSALSTAAISTPLVTAVRVGKPTPTKVRVVLDLTRDLKVTTKALDPNASHGHRLVIDLVDGGTNTSRSNKVKAPLESKRIGDGTVAATDRNRMDGVAKRNLRDKPGSTTESGTKTTEPANDSSTAMPAGEQAESTEVVAPPADRIIVVDPGHGGKDSGAVGRNKTYEKDVVLAIARVVAKEVNQIPGYRAILTREDDVYVPLRDRAEIARTNHAYAFISIHADGSRRSSVRGSSVYSLTDGAKTNARTKKLAQHMSANDVVQGQNVDQENANDRNLVDTLVALSTVKTQELGFDLGTAIMEELAKVTKPHTRKVEKANFRVLLAPGVPTILVETGFITNPSEEKSLRSKAHQRATATAIVRGLKAFLKDNESKLSNAEGRDLRG